MFPSGADGTDINATDLNHDKSLIAAGDDFGSVCVYKAPVLKNT